MKLSRPLRPLVALVMVTVLALAVPASAAPTWEATATHNADGADVEYPWLSALRVNTGVNWTITALAWQSNTSAYLSFVNSKNVTIDTGGWVDDAMNLAAQYLGRITIKMVADTAQVNFTINGVPTVTALKRNGVGIAYNYSGATKVLSFTVSFSEVTITVDFQTPIQNTINLLFAVLPLIIVVAVFSGVFGLIMGMMSKMNKNFNLGRRR